MVGAAKLSTAVLFRRSLLPWYFVGCAFVASTFPVYWMSSMLPPNHFARYPDHDDDPLTSLLKSSSSFDIVLYQFKHEDEDRNHNYSDQSFTRNGQFKAATRKQKNTIVFFGRDSEDENRDDDDAKQETEVEENEESGDNEDDDHHIHDQRQFRQRNRNRNRRRRPPSKLRTQLRHQQQHQKHEDLHEDSDQGSRRHQRRPGNHYFFW